TGGRALDVLGDDPAFGAGALERAELDAALAGDPAGERRRLDAGAGAVAVRWRTYFGDLLRGRGPAALPLLFTRRAGRAFFLRRFCSRLSRRALDRRDVFALLADDRDRRADDVGLTFSDRDLERDAGGLGLDLLGHLAGVEL